MGDLERYFEWCIKNAEKDLNVDGLELQDFRGEKEIVQFSGKMLETFNLPKNASKGDWKEMEWEHLWLNLKGELYELYEACHNLKNSSEKSSELRDRVVSEATDVALYAMMLADKMSKD